MSAGENLKAAGAAAKRNQAQRKMLDRLFKSWVDGGENTAAELLAMERQRKQDFLRRDAERQAA